MAIIREQESCSWWVVVPLFLEKEPLVVVEVSGSRGTDRTGDGTLWRCTAYCGHKRQHWEGSFSQRTLFSHRNRPFWAKAKMHIQGTSRISIVLSNPSVKREILLQLLPHRHPPPQYPRHLTGVFYELLPVYFLILGDGKKVPFCFSIFFT